MRQHSKCTVKISFLLSSPLGKRSVASLTNLPLILTIQTDPSEKRNDISRNLLGHTEPVSK